MTKLADMAKLIRSKNAGPFSLTIDIMFADQTNYAKVKHSGVIHPAFISKLYRIDINHLKIEFFDAGHAIKISFPRPTVSGSFKDADVFGGQQYGPLVDLEF